MFSATVQKGWIENFLSSNFNHLVDVRGHLHLIEPPNSDVPWSKSRQKNPPRSHTMPILQDTESLKILRKTKFQDPRFPGSHAKSKLQDTRYPKIPQKNSSWSKIPQNPTQKNQNWTIQYPQDLILTQFQDPKSHKIPQDPTDTQTLDKKSPLKDALFPDLTQSQFTITNTITYTIHRKVYGRC